MTNPIMPSQEQPHASALFLTAALLPIITTNLCYVISASQDLIPHCLTYLQGCTSISATGRNGIAYWLFKATMLPHAWILWMFWRVFAQRLAADAKHEEPSTRAMLRFGHLGAAFLVLYVIFLGADNDIYRLLRRYGVFVFFIGTFVAMSLASRMLYRRQPRPWPATILVGLCAAMLLLGLAEIPLGKFGLNDHQAENIIEWNFGLLMQIWFFVTWLAYGRQATPGGQTG